MCSLACRSKILHSQMDDKAKDEVLNELKRLEEDLGEKCPEGTEGTFQVWSPPPRLTVTEWSSIPTTSTEASSMPGMFRIELAPYRRANELGDGSVGAVGCVASQTGKTEIINNIIGYHIDLDPSPILCLQPTLEIATSWSTDRLSPMVRDTPVLKKLVADPKARDSGNTKLHKKFMGGHITIAGANSPASLAARPIRVVL